MRWLSRVALLLVLLPALATAQTTWEEKNIAGEKAFQDGRLAEANQLFTQAYQEAQKFGPKDVRLAPILNNLALVAFVQNNYIASEKIYQNAITILEAAKGKEDPLLLPVLDNLSRLYVKQWAFDPAIEVSERADHIREKRLGPENPETILGMDRLATLYRDNVRLLPHTPAELNGEHPANVAALNAFGQMEDARKLALAEGLYWKVLNAQEKTYGPENGRLVEVLLKLGEVLHAEGNRTQAEQSFTRAVGILEKTLSPNDVKLVTPLQQLASIKTESGNFADAEVLYQRALKIADAKRGPTDPWLRPLLTSYAALLQKMQRPEDAKKMADRLTTLPSQAAAAKLAPTADATSVPYVLRFERVMRDRYSGSQRTCMLVRADGSFHIEILQRDSASGGPIAALPQRSPDGMGGYTTPQDRPGDRGGPDVRGAKVFEGSVELDGVQQLVARLSAKDVRGIEGSYPSHEAQNYYGDEAISASVLRQDGVQNFIFPDLSSRRPFEEGLKPVLKWITATEKRKGTALPSPTANSCSPDETAGAPAQLIASLPAPMKGPRTETATNVARKESAPTTDALPPKSDSAPTFKVDVNLVLVRVVARDSQGHVIGTLKQEDFRLLDNRKPQTITRFSREQVVDSAGGKPEVVAGASGASPIEHTGPPAVPERSVAYLFDDLHLSTVDLEKVRAAADRQMSSLAAEVRAGIFTTSGETALDFTADRDKLQQTLAAIRPRSVGSSSANDCPHMDAYLADLIWNKHDEEALGAATGDALICAYGNDVRFAHAAEANARSAAQQMIGSAEVQSQTFLVALQNALRHLAAAPGQRTLVLVSPGFVAPGREQEFAKLMDGALRSDIIVSTLDIRGLIQLNSVGSDNGAAAAYLRESSEAASDLLQSMADITGGTFFHNSNDLDDGFKKTAATPEYSYVLGFSPPSADLDGRFHTLAVALNGSEKLTLQARKGYFAKKP